ncbi:choice-of-anchor Q domain-containing protein [Streptomyces sp. NPDC004393]|uniref:choice-of-anchor Q domain-containing protein n=1 Tax=Streptomyces sp. NPDC004533 TaxID=3154278 RepID=UPI0033B55C5A
MSAGARYRAAVRAGCFTWWRRAIAAVVGTAVAGTAFFLVTPVAQAEEASPVIEVDSTADAPLASADGSCADAQGRCTLRAAIMLSNRKGGGTTIVLPAGHYGLTIPPNPALIVGDVPDDSTGDLDVLASTKITGAGARTTAIDGNGLDRIINFSAPNGVSVLSDVTITGGIDREQDVPNATGGGGIWNYAGQLTLERDTVTGNRADYGAGVFSNPSATTVVDSSTVSNNVAYHEAGGIRFDGSGTADNSTITGNQVLATCCSDTTSDGGAYGEGGGVDVRGTGPVRISNSTITDNHAVIGGGGVNAAFAYQDTVRTSPSPTGGEVLLVNTIVAGNTSDYGSGDCKQSSAPIVSLSHNMDTDGSCGLVSPGDQPRTDPELGPLSDNGGPTDTQAEFRKSPAIDAGDESACPTYDQRGILRGNPCDIGSFESEG